MAASRGRACRSAGGGTGGTLGILVSASLFRPVPPRRGGFQVFRLVCQWSGVTRAAGRRLSKVFRAVFQRTAQPACPCPWVQGRDRHVDALQGGGLVLEVPAGLDRPPDPRVPGFDRISGADDAADPGT